MNGPQPVAVRGNHPARWRWLAVLAVALLWPMLSGSDAAGAGDASAGGGGPVAVDAPPVSAPAKQTHGSGHGDPVAPVLAGIVVLLLAARLAGHLVESIGQPAVVGELAVGMVIGNLVLVGIDQFEFLKVDYAAAGSIDLQDYEQLAGVSINMMSRIGVILLLFQVGLESSVGKMREVGTSALLVAVLGVVAPLALGWGVGWWLLPEAHWLVHLFLGATLCATSVGITARVLQDLGKEDLKESRIILGAAVIDDILGLVVLALAQGLITAMDSAQAGGSFDVLSLAWIMGKAALFLGGALLLGAPASRRLLVVASYLRGRGLLVVAALTFCFALAWIADAVGLAPIVGAFAAGLILDKVTYRELVEQRGEHPLETLIRPVADLLVPLFFVEMGIQVSLASFADASVLSLAAALTVVAIVGKQICALGVREGGLDRLSVGLGMVPRGEVGLIFAAIGRQLHLGGKPIIDEGTFSALVLMVLVTTMATPPLLKWSLSRSRANRGEG